LPVLKFTRISSLFKQRDQNLSSGSDAPDRLLFDNYEFLRKCCARVAGISPLRFIGSPHIDVDARQEIAAEELLNDLIDKLRKDDFKALREYTGKSGITTYLTTIVVNLARDRYRSATGRIRPGKQIDGYGEIGRLLQQLVMEKGFSVEAAHEWLLREKDATCSLEQVFEMVTALKNRKKAVSDPDMPKVIIEADSDDEQGDICYTLVDAQPLQDEHLADVERQHLRDRVLHDFISGLSGEELIMLRMRFPAGDEEEPKSFAEIGQLTGMTEKAADHRIRRILTSFREKLLLQGIGLDDLLDNG